MESVATRAQRRQVGEQLPSLPWRPQDVTFIRNAMFGVTQEGTAARSFVNAPFRSGGKTGTAQVIAIGKNEKYNASQIDERHRDHALYTAFAPVDEPQIALALVVENAGFGASSAAPIARRVLDYVLRGQYPSEADMAATRLGQSTAPIGTPRLAASVVLPGVTIDGNSTGLLGPLGTPVVPAVLPIAIPAAPAAAVAVAGTAASAASAAAARRGAAHRAIAAAPSR